ncbi:hypothetical protein NPIL_13531, partial [Nephila pilipes]
MGQRVITLRHGAGGLVKIESIYVSGSGDNEDESYQHSTSDIQMGFSAPALVSSYRSQSGFRDGSMRRWQT